MGAVTTQPSDTKIYLYCRHCAVAINKEGFVISSKHSSRANIPLGAFIADHMNMCHGLDKPHLLALPGWTQDEDELVQRKAALQRIIDARLPKEAISENHNELADKLLADTFNNNRNTNALRRRHKKSS